LANNIAFVFTNVPSPLHWNFSKDTLPVVLKDAPQFLLNNPISLQKKYLKLKEDQNKGRVKGLRKAVGIDKQNALEMLVELFDWLDGLEPQPTMNILSLYEKHQAIEANITSTVAQMDQAAATMVKVNELMVTSKKNSDVSFFTVLASGAPVLCSVYAGPGCFCQVHADRRNTCLDAAAHGHLQYGMQPG
jgi:hypothetical protein